MAKINTVGPDWGKAFGGNCLVRERKQQKIKFDRQLLMGLSSVHHEIDSPPQRAHVLRDRETPRFSIVALMPAAPMLFQSNLK